MVRKIKSFSIILLSLVHFASCTSQKYFFDTESSERQKELRKHRSGNIFDGIGFTIISAFATETIEINADFYPEGQEFKKLKLINPTKDTMYINMLTDVYWDEENFCDFMDIRIPPHKKCSMLVPVNANYNVYFSNTPGEEDDEMVEINTDDIGKLPLYPGLAVIKDLNLNQ
jgi:hypothetical protein